MKRIVVVGGGVVGLACAYALSKREHVVTVLDAGEPGAGASEGNAGWITPSLSMPVPSPGVVGQSMRWLLRSDSPLYIKPTLDPRRIMWLIKLLRNCREDRYRAGFDATLQLNAHTFDSFDSLAADGIEFETHRAGLLFCFADPEHLSHVANDLSRAAMLGYSPVILHDEEIRRLEPQVAPRVRAGIYLEQERQVRPESLVTGYLKRLLDDGVDLRSASPVHGVESTNGKVVGVHTKEGVVEGDEFILAAGAHSGRLAKLLFGCRIPIDAGKGYSLHYEPAPIRLSHALYLYEARVGVTNFNGAMRFAGTMEFSGINTRPAPKRVAAIEAAGRRYLEPWTDEVQPSVWAGMRPMTPDGLPVIGRIAPNVTIASGHAMLGVTLAPVTGELVAQVVAGDTPPSILRPFDPARFRF